MGDVLAFSDRPTPPPRDPSDLVTDPTADTNGPTEPPEVGLVPCERLTLFPRNPRRGKVDKIKASLVKRSQYKPITVNHGTYTGRPDEVLAGNHTLVAARELGWTHIQVSYVDVDEVEAKAIVLADNHLADLGSYDEQNLAELMRDVADAGELDATGYEASDLDRLLESLEIPEPDPVDDHDDDDDDQDPPPDTGASYLVTVVCRDSEDQAAVHTTLHQLGYTVRTLTT